MSTHAIVPISYTKSLTDVGTYEYHDWTGQQLIDGEYGEDAWSADLGNGPACEWLG